MTKTLGVKVSGRAGPQQQITERLAPTRPFGRSGETRRRPMGVGKQAGCARRT